MDTGPVTPPRRRRAKTIARRLLLAAVLMPPLALVLGNLALSSRWGRAAIARRVSDACGLPARVESASWWPWKGIVLGGLEIALPPALEKPGAKPALAVRQLVIAPDWGELAHRHFAIAEISAEEPQLTIPTGLLIHLARQVPAQPVPSQPPLLAANEPPPAKQQGPSPAPPPDAPKPPPAAATTAPPPPHPSAAGPTRRIKIRNAAVTLVSGNSGDTLAECRGIDADIPCHGAAAAGFVRAAALDVAGKPVAMACAGRLSWQAPALSLVPDENPFRIGGMEAGLAATLFLVPGFLLKMEAELPHQPLNATIPYGVGVETPAIAAKAAFAGFLLAPGTWQGEFLSTVRDLTVRHPEHAVTFDRGIFAALLHGGVLTCPEARLIGDDLSLLGNGTVWANGGVVAVCRLVAPPDTADAVVRRFFPAVDPPPRPVLLEGGLRSVLDIRVEGDAPRFGISFPPPAGP